MKTWLSLENLNTIRTAKERFQHRDPNRLSSQSPLFLKRLCSSGVIINRALLLNKPNLHQTFPHLSLTSLPLRSKRTNPKLTFVATQLELPRPAQPVVQREATLYMRLTPLNSTQIKVLEIQQKNLSTMCLQDP